MTTHGVTVVLLEFVRVDDGGRLTKRDWTASGRERVAGRRRLRGGDDMVHGTCDEGEIGNVGGFEEFCDGVLRRVADQKLTS